MTLRWAQVLDWTVFYESDDECVIISSWLDETVLQHDAEIERLESLGATRVDVGQPDDVSWTVLADPEGNEFCVLSSREM